MTKVRGPFTGLRRRNVTAASSAGVRSFLIDRAYQLEIDVTPCKQTTDVMSNRRWIAVLPPPRHSQERIPGMPVDTPWHRFHNRNEAKRS
jgi:hypothetical protein